MRERISGAYKEANVRILMLLKKIDGSAKPQLRMKEKRKIVR